MSVSLFIVSVDKFAIGWWLFTTAWKWGRSFNPSQAPCYRLIVWQISLSMWHVGFDALLSGGSWWKNCWDQTARLLIYKFTAFVIPPRVSRLRILGFMLECYRFEKICSQSMFWPSHWTVWKNLHLVFMGIWWWRCAWKHLDACEATVGMFPWLEIRWRKKNEREAGELRRTGPLLWQFLKSLFNFRFQPWIIRGGASTNPFEGNFFTVIFWSLFSLVFVGSCKRNPHQYVHAQPFPTQRFQKLWKSNPSRHLHCI